MKGKRIIIYNTLYQVIGKAITAGLGVVMMFLMTRYLGVSEFGEYNFVVAFVGLAYIFADFGLDPVLLRSRAERSITPREFSSLFTFRILILLCVWVGSALTSHYWLHYDMRVVQGIVIAGVAHSLLMLSSMIWSVLKGELSYGKIVIIQIATSAVHCLAVWIAVTAGWPLMSFYGVFTAGYTAGLVISLLYSPFPLRFAIHLPDIRKYLLLAVPFMLGVIVSIAGSRISVLMLGSMFSPSQYPYVGYFSLGLRIYDVITLIGGYYGQTLFPYFSRMKSPKERSEKFMTYCMYSVGLGVLLGSGMFVLAAPLVHFLGGAAFTPATAVVRILGIAAGITIVEGFFYSYLFALNKERIWVYIAVLSVCLNVLLNILFLPAYSYIAVSWISVGIHAVSCLAAGIAIYYVQGRTIHVRRRI